MKVWNIWFHSVPVGLLLFSLLSAGPALAGEDEAQTAASEHFDRGVELYEEGSLDAALVEFQRAYELLPDFRLLYNLGQVQAERQEYVLAAQLLEQYLKDGGDEIDTERLSKVLDDIERLGKSIAELWVEVDVDDATITVNGVEIGTSPLKRYVKINAGKAEVRIEKPGFVPHADTLMVAGRERPRLVVELKPEQKAQAPMAPQPTTTVSESPVTEEEPSYTAFWVSSGIAVALAGVAGTFGYLAYDDNQRLEDELNRFPANESRIDDLSNQVETQALISDGAAAGALLAAGFAIYFLADPPLRTVEREQTGSLRLIPTRGGAGLGVVF